MTIRRDLLKLDEKGKLKKTYGGAIKTNFINSEIPYNSKMKSNDKEKNEISKRALDFIKGNETLLLDAGTTNFALAKRLRNFKKLTIVTTDLKIAVELSENTDNQIIILGGKIQNKVMATVGQYVTEFLSNFRVDLSFIGTSAIDREYNLTTPTIDKVFIKRSMINNSKISFLLSDSSKFGKRSLNKICNISEFDYFITDDKWDKRQIKELKEIARELVVVK